jgi:glycosyltransferase involved in cell wall biosynthesis
MNNANPFFTVIIPTYNRAHLIKKTIDSVLAQSFHDFEIIVVDNKSTDNTVEVLQPYLASNSIKLFVQDRNYERARSRNKGFEEASGKFLTLLDSDDTFYTNCLEDAYQFHQANPALGFYHCSHEVVDEEGKVVTKGSLEPVDNPFKALAAGNYISNIGIFIEAGLARKVRVDETPVLIGMEDYDFLLRLLFEAKQVGFIPKINCAVLLHPQRTVLTQEMETIRNRVLFFVNKSVKSELFTREFKPYKKSFVSGNHLYLCGAAAIRKLPVEAFRHFINAGKSNIAGVFTYRYWRHFFVIIKYMF